MTLQDTYPELSSAEQPPTVRFVPDEDTRPEGQLRPIHCFHCGANNFVSSALPPMTTMPCNKCGKEIMIPYLLRNFEIRQVIASGGMGTVYRAFDTILKREVAVKLMKRELGRDHKLGELRSEILNVNGGGIALGHPVGSTGARLVVTLLKELRRRKLQRGLASLCIGGGEGIAMAVERA